MAITVYTGPPGAGKSHALVAQVIVPAICAGRRVLTNVAGIDPQEVYKHCLDDPRRKGAMGEVHLFHGSDAQSDAFWPTGDKGDKDTTVKGGDLVVFDEWGVYFKPDAALPTADLEAFLRYHRHLTNEDGIATDVVIATQMITDVKPVRGLVEGSYRFKKLTAVGAGAYYVFDVFSGHLQNKESFVKSGRGKYRDEITRLYKSHEVEDGVDAQELQTDSRASIWGKAAYAFIGFMLLVLVGGGYGLWSFFHPETDVPAAAAGQAQPRNDLAAGMKQSVATRLPSSPYRIAGQLVGDDGIKVVVVDDKGAIRMVDAGMFRFRDGRPVSGSVDGQAVVAEDRFKVSDNILEFGK